MVLNFFKGNKKFKTIIMNKILIFNNNIIIKTIFRDINQTKFTRELDIQMNKTKLLLIALTNWMMNLLQLSRGTNPLKRKKDKCLKEVVKEKIIVYLNQGKICVIANKICNKT